MWRLLRIFQWLFLLTLPVTMFPIFGGIFTGITFGIWNTQHIDKTSNTFVDEVKDLLNDWGVGGNVPTFREYLDTHNDFHLKRVNSNDWLPKLGFILPNEYSDLDDPSISIDKYANLETLMRDTSCRTYAQMPREQWLYLSYLAFPSIDQWDNAFNGVLEYVHAHPTLNQSGFHFANCGDTAGFLCGVWATRNPALLHFKVEDDPPKMEDIEDGLTYPFDLEHLRPVTVRIIEFPLKEEFTGLPLSVFPGHKQQMLSIVAGERFYEQIEPYDPWIQMQKRFTEHMDDLWDTEGTILNHINKIDSWMIDHVTKPLGIEPVLVDMGSFLMLFSAIASQLACNVIKGTSYLVGDFLGRPRPGDLSLAEAGINNYEEPEDRFWGDMMGGVAEGFRAGLQRAKAEQSSAGGNDTSISITRA
ncbi:uncharacterized protein N0V89_004001 [Didymosphaeria variabile]|uniref:Uncharacterized protein n=1 Tax=Didymosphaeria variabile TaxID=1932322 RepID=A0A9W9CD77_9PLEO|nr:uncharacterized protein N0V89_004001 [Didymosphaeria variabile]KAJ4355976.1 hypothetical protein N0V89_004001 [Didymosphaeria variabile]